jgi:demethylmenaquinone methyltransferase/2-methoxy-6-polyprenyl-1,4-benzoquinol methylase
MPPRTASAVQRTFSSSVSRTYELVNHIITFGQDTLWRRRAAKIAASLGGTRWVDMCTGTGEMAAYLRRRAPEGTTIYAVDFSHPMMAEAVAKPEAKDINFIVSDVKSLPFPDASLDLITISFATRNINLSEDILTQTFREFHRVLKPGGHFVNLETSQPASRIIRWLFHFFIKLIVKPVGSRISGSDGGYAYLSHTIPRFYPPEMLSSIMNQAGFENVTFRRMLLGAAAIHQATRL